MKNILKLLVVCCVLCGFGRSVDAADRPNIVILFSDDQGWADLGCQGVLEDVRTPHLNALGADGVRCSAGYVTAPQCSPSRAGLLTGRYQQRFGYDDISRGPLPLNEVTLADRLKEAGYSTGMVGKWHLEPDNSHQAWIQRNKGRLVKKEGSPWEFPDAVRLPYMPERRGFDEYFCGVRATKPCRINFSLDGSAVLSEGVWTTFSGSRTQVHSKAALTFINRRKLDEPFFLYLSYSIPHVPLEASEELLARFPGEMPQRRRYALAMISEMDDGVGRIVDLLKRRGQYDNTLFFFASDNGAPLKLNMPDTKPPTLGGPTWTGSRNDPFSGEKGMLAEGGIRVPLLITWKKHLPARTVYDQPVITLDIAATALAAAGISSPAQLDGVDLLPFLKGDNEGRPHQTLFWRFWSQAAVREGDWKYLQAGPDKAYLFNLEDDPKERVNLLYQHPEKAASLAKAAGQWAAEMRPPGLPDKPLKASEQGW